MPYKIITHNGKAHIDELLAAALLAVYKNELPEKIIRINSQEASVLAESGEYDENTYFIDCGLVYDAEKNMFDHHQDINLSCSALLVFEHFFPELYDTNLHDYIKLVSRVDTGGIKALDDFDTASESRKYFSFSQNLILKKFEESPLQITGLFKEGLSEKIDFAAKRILASEWLYEKGNIGIAEVEDKKILVYKRRPPLDLFQAVRAEDSRIIDLNKADAAYSFDENSENVRTLFRTNHGHESLDFSRSEVSETVFCHKGGFLLKFIPSDEKEWEEIIRQSSLSGQLC